MDTPSEKSHQLKTRYAGGKCSGSDSPTKGPFGVKSTHVLLQGAAGALPLKINSYA